MANSSSTAGSAVTPPGDAGASHSEFHMPHAVLFLLLPAIAMSLGWGLRGTIGGGQIGAMIPGAIVTLCLCHLLGWSRSTGIVAAIGTVGVGLGGQETYGQTIGFLRDTATVPWGLTGLTIKGAMWGLSGGVLIGLALMHEKYRWCEIACGMGLMIAGTVLGRMLVDAPKLAYFSNRLDKPREELWVGLTLGALALVAYLAVLNRERISSAFAWGGLLAGGAGFGIGGAFIALGFTLPDPYRSWSWWKVMEFTFGLLYGLGMGAVCYRHREVLRNVGTVGPGNRDLGPGGCVLTRDDSSPTRGAPATHSEPLNAASSLCTIPESASRDLLGRAPAVALMALGLIVAVGGLWLNFSYAYRAAFSVIAPALVMLALCSNRLAWHIALSMTTCGFIRDYLRREVERGTLAAGFDGWMIVAIATIPVVVIVALTESKGRLTPARAILSMSWIATLFGLVKVGIPVEGKGPHLFVPAVFIVEAIATAVLVLAVRPKKEE